MTTDKFNHHKDLSPHSPSPSPLCDAVNFKCQMFFFLMGNLFTIDTTESMKCTCCQQVMVFIRSIFSFSNLCCQLLLFKGSPKKHYAQSDSSLTGSSGHYNLIPLDLFHFGPSDHIIDHEVMIRSPEGQKALRWFALLTGSGNFEVGLSTEYPQGFCFIIKGDGHLFFMQPGICQQKAF